MTLLGEIAFQRRILRGGGHAEDLSQARAQAVAEREAGVLALRDCGSPVDTRALDDEPDLPTIIRAGRHIARTRRYIPGLGVEIEPEDLVEQVRQQICPLMSEAAQLDVPLLVEAGVGNNWDEAH